MRKRDGHTSVPIGASIVVLSSMVFASYGAWVELLGNFLDDFTQATIRALLVVVMILPIAIWKKELSPMRWKQDKYLLIGQLIACALIPAPFFYAVKIIGVGLATALLFAGILLGAFIFGAIFNNEKYTLEKFVSTLFGIAGLWFVVAPNTKEFGFLALLSALVGGFAGGLNMVINKKLQYSASQVTLIAWGATAVANLPLIFLFHQTLPNIELDTRWIYLVIFAVASMAASWLLIIGLKLIDAGTAGILGLLEIVFGVVIGVVFFDESPKPISLFGMLLILIAAAIPYYHHYKSDTEAIVKI